MLLSTPLDTARLWEVFHEDLHAFLRRRVSDETIADDLLQETFVRIHGHLDRVSDQERVASWIYRIARNLVADHYRSQLPVHELEDRDGKDPPEDPTDGEDNENQRVGGWLREMIDSLPPTYREPVLLHEVEGLDQKAVARRLGLSVSGAKSRIQRGRKQLVKRLLDCCHVEFDRRGNVVRYRKRPDCC